MVHICRLFLTSSFIGRISTTTLRRSLGGVMSAAQKSSTRSFSLKDHLFNKEKVEYLSTLLQGAHSAFPKKNFENKVLQAFPELQLKQRIAHISDCLYEALDPLEYPTALDILLRSLPAELDTSKTDDDFGDFIFAPFSHYVASYGCTREHLRKSLDALHAMTKRFSVEFSIRRFLNEFPHETMEFLQLCTLDPSYHVRRLASEGSRPKLPWAHKLTAIHYKDTIPILDALCNDGTRYVTRSVANHLHDISKLDPGLVLQTLTRWRQQQPSEEMEYICQHALRTLVNQKHKGALALLGFQEPKIRVTDLVTTTPQVVLGEALEFSLNLKSFIDQQLVLDYTMEFATATNKKPAPSKVFKLKKWDATKGQVVTVRKRHPLRVMTTRKLVTGTHKITLQVNGKSLNSLEFELVETG